MTEFSNNSKQSDMLDQDHLLRALQSRRAYQKSRKTLYDYKIRLRREMNTKMFCLQENNPAKFATTSWMRSQIPYLVYRLLVFSHAIAVLIWKAYDESNQQRDASIPWIITLPAWTFILYGVYHTFSLIFTILEFFHDCLCNDDLSWYHQASWVLQSIVFNGSVLCFIGSIIHTLTKFAEDQVAKEWFLIFTSDNVNFTYVVGIIMVIEVFITNVTVRLLHVIYPFFFYMLFFLFHIYRWSAGFTPDYIILDYGTHPSLSISCIFVVLLIWCPCVHLLAYGVDTLRWKLLLACFKRHKQRLVDVSNEAEGLAFYVATAGKSNFSTQQHDFHSRNLTSFSSATDKTINTTELMIYNYNPYF